MSPDTYALKYQNAQILPSCALSVHHRANLIISFSDIYEKVGKATGIPWRVVGCLHNQESGLKFNRHLHNGDPLTARTVHVPAGRPVDGNPPFTWQDSAIDALRGRLHPEDWSIGNMLIFCERYNGLGYYQKGVPSPYIWAMTTEYGRGLFMSDGQFDANAVSQNFGVAAVLKSLGV